VASYEEYLEAIAFFAPIVPNEWVKVVLTIESSIATIEFESSVGHTEWSVDISGYSTRTINFVSFGHAQAPIGDFVRLDTVSITDIPVPSPPSTIPPTGFYNEGDHFAYAPGDSGGTAVWREPSASSTPVTTTHQPGCGYWFKETGTVYGGEVGPWVPWNVDQKVEFNEGSSITKSPSVSGGSPIWKVGETGPAITSGHIPCGYWAKGYVPPVVTPPVALIKRYWIGGSGVFEDSNHWSETSGGVGGASVPFTADFEACFDENSGFIEDSYNYVEIYSTILCALTVAARTSLDLETWGSSGIIILQNDIENINYITIVGGSLVTNSFNVTVAEGFYISSANTIDFGTSVITCTGDSYANNLQVYIISATSFSVSLSTIILNVSIPDDTSVGGISPTLFVTNYDLGTLQINMLNAASKLKLEVHTHHIETLKMYGVGTVCPSGVSEVCDTTLNSVIISGDTSESLVLDGTDWWYVGYVWTEHHTVWNMTKTSGSIDAVNTAIAYNNAVGGASFNALVSSGCKDNGNNTGWNF
jgi:hypothetical protein